MKLKLIKTLICVFIINIIFVLTNIKVKAALTSYNGGEYYQGQYIGTGNGAYKSQCFGFRLSVVSQNKTLKDAKIFINDNGDCSGAKFSGFNGPKLLYPDWQIGWLDRVEFPGQIISLGTMPGSWNDIGIFNDYLSYENFANLKYYISQAGFNLSSSDYIVVEPMTVIDNYYGTAFEFVNSFGEVTSFSQGHFSSLIGSNSDGNAFLSRYSPLFQGHGGIGPGLFFSTIFVNKDNDLGVFSYENKKDEYQSQYNYSNDYYETYATRVICLMDRTCGRGMGLYKYSEIYGNTSPESPEPSIPTYTLSLRKTDADTNYAMSGVKFDILNKYGNKLNGDSYTTDSYGNIKISDLESGLYYLVETMPNGYYFDGSSCQGCERVLKIANIYGKIYNNVFEIKITKDKNISISNKRSCESAFEIRKVNGNVSWSDRVSLYNKYKKTNLLDMNKTTGSLACTDASACNFEKSTSCLNASVRLPESKFNSSNLSCFKIRVNNLFCSPEFYFRSNISTTFGPIKMGQSIISFNNPYSAKIGTGELRYKCYNPLGGPTDNVVTYYLLDYSSFVSSKNLIKFGNSLLNWKPYKKDNWNWENAVLKELRPQQSKDGSYNYTAKVDYYLTDTIYIKYGNGQLTSEKCQNCTFLGYGLISKLSNNPKRLDFRINLTSGNKFGISSLTGFCPVTYDEEKKITPPKCEVVNGVYYDNNGNVVSSYEYGVLCRSGTGTKDLNLEFRLIDKTNPFPGVSGTNTRLVGSNWCDSSNNISGNCSSNNNTVEKYIKDKNDSYNSTKDGPIYTITLTPNDIKNIRKYNDSTTYDDYNFNCEKNNNSNCTSQFLEKLKNKYLTNVTGGNIGSLSENIFWEKDSK